MVVIYFAILLVLCRSDLQSRIGRLTKTIRMPFIFKLQRWLSRYAFLIFLFFSQLLIAAIDQALLENHTHNCEPHTVISENHTAAECLPYGGLVSDWRFDEAEWNGVADDVQDSSGHDLHGTPTVDTNTVDDGQICRAGDFTKYKYIQIADDAKHRSDSISLSVWVKPEDSFNVNASTILMKSSSSAWTDGYGLSHYNGANTVSFFVNHYNNYKVTATLDPAVWSHVVGTYDGSVLNIYVNGVLQNSLAYSGTINHSTSDLLIGRGAGSNNYYWDGKIDEVQFYQSAMTVSEVLTVYNNQLQGLNSDGTTRSCQVLGNPVADWRMDESAWVGTTNEVANNIDSNHGDGVNGANTSSDAQICRAGDFDGVDDTVTLDQQISFSDTSNFSVSLWYKGTDTAQNGNWGKVLVGRDDNDIYANVVLRDGYVEYLHHSSSWLHNARSTTMVADDQWHHIAVTHHANETVDIYIDGVQEISGESSSIDDDTYPFRIDGFMLGFNNVYTQGHIDEVQIYDKTISAADIQTLYTNQAAGKNADGSTRICPLYKVAEWRLEESTWAGVTDEVKDVIGSHHGTATSASVDKTSPAITTRPGTCGYGLFDGVDDKVDIPFDTALNTPNFTVSLWARVDGGAGTYRSPVSSRLAITSTTDRGGYFLYAGSNNKWQFWTGYSNTWGILTGSDVVDGDWTHLAIRFKADGVPDVDGNYSGTKTLFVDGVAVASAVQSYRPNSTEVFTIGAALTDGAGIRWFNGAIDEVQYFDADLSDAAIAALMNETHPCSAKLVSEWRMDEFAWSDTAGEVQDLSGNNLDGLPVGGVDTIESGQVCRAGDFTKDQYVRITDDSRLQPDNISVATWVKPEGSFTVDWSTVLMKSSSSSWLDGYGLMHYNSGETVNFFVNDYSFSKVSATLDPTIWSHVVGTYDGSELKIYVNGVLQETKEYSGVINHPAADLQIGKGTGSNNYYWDGKIDETRVYDGALTADEVITVMNETRICAVQPNLIGEWRLDESEWQGFTGEVKDNSGNSFNGTMTGGATPLSGKVCNAGDFTGTDSQIQIADDAAFEGNAHTITAWVKASSWGGNIVSKDGATSGRQWMINTALANGRIRAHVWTTTGIHYADSSTIVPVDEWHHLTQVWDGSKLYLYIDGVLDGNFPINATGTLATGTLPITIGGNTLYFDGQIDEVRYYDAGLDVSAIRNVMNETHPCEQACQVDSTDQLLFEDDFDDGDYAGWSVHNLGSQQCDWSVIGGQLSEATNACVGLIGHQLNTLYQDLTNYTIQVDAIPVIPGGNNGVGIMFGYEDANNYYLARWYYYGSIYSSSGAYRDFELLKVVNGASTVLDKRDDVSLPDNFRLTVKVSDVGGIDVFVGCDTSVFNLHADNEAPQIKEFGLYSFDNESRIYYDNIKVYGAAVKQLIGEWRFDESLWNGTPNEVLDSSHNFLHGTAIGGAVTAGSTPAIGDSTSGTCGYGVFDGSAGNKTTSHVRLPTDDRLSNISDGITLAGWVKPTVKGSYNTLISSDGAWASFERGYSLTTYHETPMFVIRDEFGHLQSLVGTGTMPTNEWHHLAGTFDGTQMKVYVDGVLKGTKNLTNKIGTPTTFNTALGGVGLNPGVYNFTGSLDELRIYNYGLTETEINTVMNSTRVCGVPYIDHFTVSHDTTGINCLNEIILVNAYDTSNNIMEGYTGTITLDTNSGRGTWVSTTGAGILTDAVTDDGLATYTFSTVDKGVTTFQLSYKEGPTPINIDVYDGAKRDDDNEGVLSFYPSGFVLTASKVSNPPPVTINDPILIQIAAQDFNVHVTAYGQDSTDAACGIIESYTGNKSLRLWSQYADPVTGTQAVKIDGSNIPTSSTSTTRTVTFVNGQAEVTANYSDAGMMSLHFYDTDTPYDLIASTNNFVVKPDHLTMSVVRTSDSQNNPAAANAAGAIFMAAGDDFTVTVTAENSDNAATPNFGKESTPETINVDHSLLAPTGGALGALNGTATLALSGGGIFSGTFNFSEVGVISLAADITDGQYLGTDNLSISNTVGRFIPDHFEASNLQFGALDTTCSAGGFTYTGQSFGYAAGSNPSFEITAKNALGGVTTNYSDSIADFARLGAASASLLQVTQDTTTLGADAVTNMAVVHSQAAKAISEISGGLFRYTLGNDSFTYSRDSNSLVGAFNADIDLIINSVVDSDGVTDNFDPANKPILEPTASSIRYGRLSIGNGFGSELLDMVLPVSFQVYNSSIGDFVTHTDDNCSASSLKQIIDEDGSDDLTAGSLSTSFSGAAVNGMGSFNITAPGEYNTGTARIVLDAPAWLEFDWGRPISDPNRLDPQGTATFGIYHGNKSIIFTREVR